MPGSGLLWQASQGCLIISKQERKETNLEFRFRVLTMGGIIKCPFCITEESTDLEASSEVNFIGNIIEKTAYAIFFIGLIVGIIQGYSINEYEFTWSIAFIWWASGFISSIGFLGFAEVIRILNSINQKLEINN